MDSTRKGKRVPDALSKTIPIWCATINNAVRKCALQNQGDQQENCRVSTAAEGRNSGKEQNGSSCGQQQKDEPVGGDGGEGAEAAAAALLIPALNGDTWDTRYHSLPSLISRSEHTQIAAKIEGFAEKLMVTPRLYNPDFPFVLPRFIVP